MMVLCTWEKNIAEQRTQDRWVEMAISNRMVGNLTENVAPEKNGWRLQTSKPQNY